MADISDDDILELDMKAAGEFLKGKRQGAGEAICLALLLRTKKPTWRYYKKAHDIEWKRIEKLRAAGGGIRQPGLHESPNGYLGGFLEKEIVRIKKGPNS
ncbi:MAG: hypothetical protein KIS73_23500 [Enhydrobacter sp.]|nr:hypothetical protein [Enhydrobacter sp.]